MSNYSHGQQKDEAAPTHNDRRKPAGLRGKERRRLILDTAADLLIEEGLEGVNTNALADRAGISVGSVYQYFSNKEAILNGLGARYLEELERNTVTALTQDLSGLSIAEMVDRVVDPMIRFEKEHPAFGALLAGLENGGSLTTSTRQVDGSILDTIKELLGRIRPDMAKPDLERIAAVTKALYKSTSRFVHHSDHEDPTALIADMKQVMASYLETQLGPED